MIKKKLAQKKIQRYYKKDSKKEHQNYQKMWGKKVATEPVKIVTIHSISPASVLLFIKLY